MTSRRLQEEADAGSTGTLSLCVTMGGGYPAVEAAAVSGTLTRTRPTERPWVNRTILADTRTLNG